MLDALATTPIMLHWCRVQDNTILSLNLMFNFALAKGVTLL